MERLKKIDRHSSGSTIDNARAKALENSKGSIQSLLSQVIFLSCTV
jgi:hypothetical protein